MKRFEKLAYLNTLANDCLAENDIIMASKFHNEFMKIAQTNQSETKYTTDSGDSFYLIARKFRNKGYTVGAEEIAKRNNMKLRDTLYAGQPLIIPLRGGKAPKTGIDEEMTEDEPMM